MLQSAFPESKFLNTYSEYLNIFETSDNKIQTMFFHKLIFIGIIAFLFSVSGLYGKTGVSAGYIITNQGDTLKGEIKDYGLKKNTRLCSFREKDTKDYIDYKPGNIHSFRFNSKYYISKDVTFDDSNELLFVEFMVNGIIDLYYLQFNNILYYLIEDEDGAQTLIRVNNETAKSKEDLEIALKDQSRKKGALNYIMKDYPPIYSELEKVYIEDSKAMRELFVSYHNGVCTEYDCIDYSKKDSKSQMFLGISYGFQKPKMIFYDLHLANELREVDIESSWSSYFGIDFSFTLPVISERFGVHSKLEFSKEKFDYIYNLGDGAFSTIKYSYAALELNFEYRLGSGNVTFLPYVGFGFNMLYNQDSFVLTSISDKFSTKLSPLRISFNSGLSLDIPLHKSHLIYLRPSIDYRLAFIKKIDYENTYINYKYSSLGFSVTLIKYL